MTAIHATLAVSLSVALLSGCAGVSQFTGSNFGLSGTDSASSGASMSMGSASNQSISASSIGAEVNSTGSNSRADLRSTIGDEQIADPINAPPPLGAIASSRDVSGQSAMGSRPLMLVPAPGQTSVPVVPPQTGPEKWELLQGQAADRVGKQPVTIQSADQMSSPMPNPEDPLSVPAATIESGNVRGREFIPASTTPMGSRIQVSSTLDVAPTPEQTNVLLRFLAMDRLLAKGLITRDEYERRRGENLGALLPYTHAAPSAGLTRPVPSPDALSSRLQALKRTLEMRAITPRQHALERGMILDAVLPGTPRSRALAEPYPSDVLAAATRVGFLERLRVSGVISQSEFDPKKRRSMHFS